MFGLILSLAGAATVALTVLHVVICLFLIFVVLLQRGRSQDLASAFGGGQTQANLAAMSTDDFLTRATKISAFLFMGTSLTLALFAQGRAKSVIDVIPGNDRPAVEDEAEATGATGETGLTGDTGAAAPVEIVPQPIETPVEPAPAPTDATDTPAEPPTGGESSATGP